MDPLKTKFLDFRTLNRYTFKYELINGTFISFEIRQQQFPHLIGLHKLIDMPLVLKFNDQTNKTISANYILSKIKKEELTESQIKASRYYSTIQNRYNFLTKEALLSLSFNEVVIDFDSEKATTKLNSKYIFIESKNSGYLHLGIAEYKSRFYPETFFFDNTDYYFKNQVVVKIKKIQIFDDSNRLVLEETLLK